MPGGSWPPPYGSHADRLAGSRLSPVLFGELLVGPPAQSKVPLDGPLGKVYSW